MGFQRIFSGNILDQRLNIVLSQNRTTYQVPLVSASPASPPLRQISCSQRRKTMSSAAAKAFTFTIDETTERVLDDLKSRLGKTSRAEVLRKAIALLEVATSAKDEGNDVAIVDKNGNIVTRIMLV
jgi:hypothetical protein